jgi:hypothetical protein
MELGPADVVNIIIDGTAALFHSIVNYIYGIIDLLSFSK